MAGWKDSNLPPNRYERTSPAAHRANFSRLNGPRRLKLTCQPCSSVIGTCRLKCRKLVRGDTPKKPANGGLFRQGGDRRTPSAWHGGSPPRRPACRMVAPAPDAWASGPTAGRDQASRRGAAADGDCNDRYRVAAAFRPAAIGPAYTAWAPRRRPQLNVRGASTILLATGHQI